MSKNNESDDSMNLPDEQHCQTDNDVKSSWAQRGYLWVKKLIKTVIDDYIKWAKNIDIS